jgi:MFS family permease
LIEVAFGAVYIWAAPTLARSYSLSPDRVGEVMALALLVSGTLGPVLGGIVADACQATGGPRRTLSAICLLTMLTAPVGLFGMAPGIGSASLMLVLFFLVITASIVTETTLFTVVLPNEIRGLSVAISFAAGTLASLGLAPVVVSLLAGAVGGPAVIGKAVALVSVTTSILAAATFTLGRRSFGRRPSLLLT